MDASATRLGVPSTQTVRTATLPARRERRIPHAVPFADIRIHAMRYQTVSQPHRHHREHVQRFSRRLWRRRGRGLFRGRGRFVLEVWWVEEIQVVFETLRREDKPLQECWCSSERLWFEMPRGDAVCKINSTQTWVTTATKSNDTTSESELLELPFHDYGGEVSGLRDDDSSCGHWFTLDTLVFMEARGVLVQHT